MTPPPLRWGLLATGSIARKFASSVKETTSGVLIAAGSRQQASADAFAAEFDIPHAHGSYEALLANPEVEAVYISTPHPMHVEWSVAAARAGKHILCEKPFTMNAHELESIAAAAQVSDVFLMEAFMYRCHPFVARIGEIVASGEIGEVGLIEAVFGINRPFDASHRLFNRSLGGGGILDLGCYPVSISRFIAGAAMGKPFAEPVELVGTARLSPETGVDVVATANLKFENGILASLSCGPALLQDTRVRIYGSLAKLEVVSHPWFAPGAGVPVELRITTNDGVVRTEEVVDARSVYAIEADAVAEAIRSGQTQCRHMTVADSLGNMRALDRWLAAAGVSYDQARTRDSRPGEQEQ